MGHHAVIVVVELGHVAHHSAAAKRGHAAGEGSRPYALRGYRLERKALGETHGKSYSSVPRKMTSATEK